MSTNLEPPPSRDSGRVRTLHLPDEPRGSRRSRSAATGRFAVTSRTSWLIPPVMLSAVLVGFAIVFNAPAELFGIALAVLFAVLALWVFTSVFFPASAEFECPRCGAESLERLRPDSTVGLRCASCGYVDAESSSWMLAEHEGVPLEDIVLEDRGRARPKPSANAQRNAREE